MATVDRTVAGAAAATTITAPMTTGSPASGGGTFSVTNGSGYPTADFVVVIDRGLATEEKILCSARSANVITVGTAGRGFDGTAAAAHSNGATLEHELDAAVITALLEHVNTNAGDDHQGYLPAATAAGAGLSVAARVLAVNVDASTIEINADTLRLKDGGVTSAKIADATIVTADLADSSVTSAKIVDATIATGDLADDAVTNPKLANMANGTVKGRFTAGTSDPEDVTMAQLLTMLGLDYVYARKTANESVTSSTTLQDDDHLSVAVAANTTYEVLMVLHPKGAAAADLKFQLVAPAGAAFAGTLTSWDFSLTASPASYVDLTTVPATGIDPSIVLPAQLIGLLRTAGTAGTLKLQWAQAASSGTATQLLVDSFLRIRKVA